MRPPDSTYRLQFRNGMDFAKAVALIPHLVELGISHLYASPVFTAVRGSTHGYDITDYNEIDPVLGGQDGFLGLVRALKAEGLGIILDIVPNHMAAHLENDWWHSVVEWGRASAFAGHFDIDWNGPLTLPFLDRSFDEELAAGNVRLALNRTRNCLSLRYHDAPYPLNPASYAAILRDGGPVLERIAATAGAAKPKDAARLHAEIAAAFPSPAASAELEDLLARFSADTERMRRLHVIQPWRLTSWRTARDHLSYRRFFEVAGLIGMRVEDPAVFEDTHRLALSLVRDGLIDGLRIDHIDGLAHPEAYLRRLREGAGDRAYIVVEKILQPNEALPPDWPVDGTTGYEFISALAELLTDETSGLWHEDGISAAQDAVRECKLQALHHGFNTEVMRLARLAARLGNAEVRPRHHTAEAIRQLMTALPVYRTYVSDRGASERDRRLLDEIGAQASALVPAARAEIALLVAALKGELAGSEPQSAFRTRFQQQSGAVTAKAVEDTFFYRRGDYLAANEVGADPCWRPGGVDRFHRTMQERAEKMPNGLSATSTHDTKRGEDARARLYALSEAPDAWTDAVRRWHGMNAGRIRHLPGGDAPEPSAEQFLYQSLLGVWPVEPPRDDAVLSSLRERMIGFAIKAVREAKLSTSWDSPDDQYETAIEAFVGALLDRRDRAFIEHFDRTARPFIQAGLINSLAQTLVKLTAPGIPDIYQGSERLDLSLVDPDNRRSFSALASPAALPRTPTAGDFEDCKQWLIGTCLHFRRDRGAELLAGGDYRPLEVQGPGSRHAAAFMRSGVGGLSITIVPRLVFGHVDETRLSVRADLWRDTRVTWPSDCPPRRLRDILTGATIEPWTRLPIAEMLRDFPVALLVDA
ncbi:malto-oligosyltrehalose synthase [Sinorhizobium saheli]|uniref:Maltooligosyl trehalose synthase n=1 Tax=Sinorhizobium saheli TaxID=36856 RepID=A0A178YP00_SINSA|nr:malto-oligosyltrehalose synthase [Sinorhizobium saheli]MQW89421.1 malto-oligosyltrehalose synthase [Sinorhizobium saheli]OAP49147.1 maltooligosyl trehalose synthase [Sinorhizobium saheli]